MAGISVTSRIMGIGRMLGAQSGLGPIWALMGPYMGLPGQVLEVLEDSVYFRELSVETFGQISHVSDPKLVF